MKPSEDRLALGCRLIVGKHNATVRFIGNVKGQDGNWVGLEWDDPSRGKHDGSHDGVRYFSCTHHPCGGSLVRLAKLIATADLGQTLESAIQTRYKEAGNTDGNNASEGAYVSTASHRHVPIELVGADVAAAAAGEDGLLCQASVEGMRVASLELTPPVGAFLRNIESLDLSNNLIDSWSSVRAFITQLPMLHTLNLSGNLMAIGEQDVLPPSGSSPSSRRASLHTLVLNNGRISWPHAAKIASSLPSLRTLHLCGNAISSFKGVEGADMQTAFPQLHTLDIEDNFLADWEEVESLRDMPALHTLLLSGNSLSKIAYLGGFLKLERLMLGGNKLTSWRDVDQLERFPILRHLRLSDNPLTEEDPAAARYEAIARIGGLVSFNGSEIRGAERRDAELAYLRRVTDEIAAAVSGGGASGSGAASRSGPSSDSNSTPLNINKDIKESILALHPRFEALSARYGPLAASAAGDSRGHTLASSMVELVFIAGSKQVKKKVPATLTIGRLKPLLEKLLRVKIAHQALTLVPPDGNLETDGEEVTHEEGRELGFYSLTDGWRVVVQSRSPQEAAAAASAARRAAAALQELRMDQHEEGLQRLKAEEERLMIA